MSSTFDIRQVMPSDAQEFRRVRLRGLAEHPEAFSSTVAEWDGPIEKFVERLETAYVIGAFEAGTATLRGHVLLASHVRASARLAHKCEVWSVYVEPEARGNGLSRRMLEAAITEARLRGLAWLKLSVTEGNDAAKALYERLGFEVYGYELDHKRLDDGRALAEFHMQMRL